jgi:cytochrome c oxidase cbb3-type subunit 3
MSERENDQIREHSFDGIQEYDKRLPNWWLWTLWGAIVFSVFYWFNYHVTEFGRNQDEKLDLKMTMYFPEEAANKMRDLTDADLWTMSQSAKIVANGEKIYTATCASCHGPRLQGGIGLNLVDAEWKHGGNPLALVNVVRNGVLEAGMPAWGAQLGDTRVAEVVAYVLSHHKQPDA